MEPLQDWRSPQFEEELGQLDRGGVAFEFLRRNKNYHADYQDTSGRIASSGKKRLEAIELLSARWGVTFPGRPIPASPDFPSDLATATLSSHHHR